VDWRRSDSGSFPTPGFSPEDGSDAAKANVEEADHGCTLEEKLRRVAA